MLKEAVRLILQHVDSLEKLDIVVLAATCPTPLSLADIARGAHIPLADATRVVSALCSSGVLTHDADGYACPASDHALGAQVADLVRVYLGEPLVVLDYLGKQALRRRYNSARRGYGSTARDQRSCSLRRSRKR